MLQRKQPYTLTHFGVAALACTGRTVGYGDKGAMVPLPPNINPISVKDADYAHHITTHPPGFSDLPTALTGGQLAKTYGQMMT